MIRHQQNKVMELDNVSYRYFLVPLSHNRHYGLISFLALLKDVIKNMYLPPWILCGPIRVLKGFGAPGLRAKKCRAPGLQDKHFRALGLHIICFRALAPLWSTIFICKNSFFNAKSNMQIKKSAIPINIFSPRSRLYFNISYYLKVD